MDFETGRPKRKREEEEEPQEPQEPQESQQEPGIRGAEEFGRKMQGCGVAGMAIGCLLTLFITIPLILLAILLL